MKKLSSFLLTALLFISTLLFVAPNASAASNSGWQTYIDEQLVGQGLSQAAITGKDGSIWAHSEGFEPSQSETKALADLYNNPSEVFTKGITLAGKKYMGIKGDDRSIYGIKGATGAMAVKTGQTILIGIYDENTQPGNAAVTVEKLGDYLLDNGY